MKNIILVLLFAVGFGIAGSYNVDPPHSQINFTVKHLKILSLKGKFKDFDIKIDFDDTGKIKALSGTVDVKSIDTGTKKRDNHLRNPDFFDSDTFPTMSYQMKKYKGNSKKGIVEGIMTIRGVSKSINFDVELSEITKNDYNQVVKGVSLKTEINRKDFNVGTSFAAKTIADTVLIEIDFEVIKI